jgi:hypothetical protein
MRLFSSCALGNGFLPKCGVSGVLGGVFSGEYAILGSTLGGQCY